MGELLCCPLGFALCLEFGGHRVSQLEQNFDVEGGVVEPGVGEGSGRPVGRAVPLLQGQAEGSLDYRTEADAVESGQAAGEFGVVQRGGDEPQFGETGQVLVRGVQYPFERVDDLGQGCEVAGDGNGVEQHGACAAAAELHEVRTLGVAEAGRALGVDSEGPVACGKCLCGCANGIGGVDDVGNPVSGGQQRNGDRLVRFYIRRGVRGTLG